MKKHIALITISTMLAGCGTKEIVPLAPVPALPDDNITSKSAVIPRKAQKQYIGPSPRETVSSDSEIRQLETTTLRAPDADVPVEFIEGAYVITPRNNEEDARVIEAEVHAIMDETGFTNRMLTLDVGQTLVITNKSKQDRWPFCAPYPRIDSGRVLQKNDTYAFKFSEPGLYPISDKLDPYNKLTVYVR